MSKMFSSLIFQIACKSAEKQDQLLPSVQDFVTYKWCAPHLTHASKLTVAALGVRR